jgi:hypothetical protein
VKKKISLLDVPSMKLYIYTYLEGEEGGMVKRVNALIPDEMHKALRVKLVENDTNFSDWLRGQINQYLAEKEDNVKRRKGKEA